MHQDRLDKFSENAHKLLALAREEARRLGQTYIGTEHLLLGLLQQPDSTAGRALQRLGIRPDLACHCIEFIVGQGQRWASGAMGLTPRAKKVLDLAEDEAQRYGRRQVGTEHLLLALVREREGIAAGVLESLGVSLEKARHTVVQMLAQPIPASERAPTLATLRQVLPVAQSRERGGVTVAILSLEDYADGFVLVVRVAASDMSAAAAGPAFTDVVVVDDRGQRYDLLARSAVGSGSLADWRAALIFTSAIEPAARELHMEAPQRDATAEWTFRIALSSDE